MPTSLTFDEHLAHLEASGAACGDLAVGAGLDVAVPTCPGWTTKSSAHQAMVHRFAAANVGGDPSDYPDDTTILAEVDDLVGYYRRNGHAALRPCPCALYHPTCRRWSS